MLSKSRTQNCAPKPNTVKQTRDFSRSAQAQPVAADNLKRGEETNHHLVDNAVMKRKSMEDSTTGGGFH